MKRKRLRVLVLGLPVSVSLLIAAVPAQSASPGSEDFPTTSPDVSGSTERLYGQPDVVRITLVTGDVALVRRSEDGRLTAALASDNRGRTSGFRLHRINGDLYLFPAVTVPYLSGGRLDLELFNLSRLIDSGYDDAHLGVIPLIASYAGSATQRTRRLAAAPPAGSRQLRRLTSIGAAALTAPKARAHTFWESVDDDRPGQLAVRSLDKGISKLWLNQRVKTSLADSVPQIGAPAAWQAGWTGAGVQVAVLDTGIDADHPDLAGKVATARSFLGGDDGVSTDDDNGHGTHVADIIAGSGAASGGSRKGVAPDARLLVGKVLDGSGSGWESDVIAGMEWAVDSGADVVNLSLGGFPTDGTDPASQAVDMLSQQSDTLFVVAAGNLGVAQSVIAPGAASSALTVGAVDKQDVLAEFSSRGPRLGDFGLKPEITAPGVDIVAARARNGWIGDPIDDDYVSLSGTSMATPHVAGAAAILAQQHPDWAGEQIKTALISTAHTIDGATVFEQGAGRVDVAGATRQTVQPSTGTVSFGTMRWPHETQPPVERSLTYTNPTSETVAVTLTAEMGIAFVEPGSGGGGCLASGCATQSRAGGAASTSVSSNPVTVSPDRLRLDPGQTGSVTVRFDPQATVGVYAGQLVAQSQDGTQLVRTLLGGYLEPERYDLSVRLVNRDGTPTDAGSAYVFNLDTGWDSFAFFDGDEHTFRVPPGTYMAVTVLDEVGSDTFTSTLATEPELVVAADTSVLLDARTAVPVGAKVPHAGAQRFAAYESVIRSGPDPDVSTEAAAASPGGLYATPTRAVGLGTLRFNTWQGLAPPVASPEQNSPYTYDLVTVERRRIPESLMRTYRRDELAEVVTRYNAHVTGHRQYPYWNPVLPEPTFFFVDARGVTAPATRTEYLSTDHGVRWVKSLSLDEFGEAGMLGPEQRFKADHRYSDTWMNPVGRYVIPPGSPEDGPPASRRGDTLFIYPTPFTDGGKGHEGFAFGENDHHRTRLYRNGELIYDQERFYALLFHTPPELSDYRMTVTSTRTEPWWRYSTQTSATWTFQSGHTPEAEPVVLPLLEVDFTVPTDNLGRVPAGEPLPVGVTITSLTGVRGLTLDQLEVSYDDGTAWQPVPATRIADGHYRAQLSTPTAGTCGYAALRIGAHDSDGNTVTESMTRAYGITG